MNAGSETIANLALKMAKNLQERVTAGEETQAQILAAVNQTFQQQAAQLSQAVEVLNALVVLNGDEKVAETMKANRKQAKANQAEQEKKEIEAALTTGVLKPSAEATDQSVVVCREVSKTGEEIEPWARFRLPGGVKPEYLAGFVGKKPGDRFEVPGGNDLEILSVYEVQQPAPAAQEAK